MENAKNFINKFGLPRIIITLFFLFLVVAAGGFRMNLPQLLSDCVRRWGMFGILALAMVPAVQCGIGLNFGISMVLSEDFSAVSVSLNSVWLDSGRW